MNDEIALLTSPRIAPSFLKSRPAGHAEVTRLFGRMAASPEGGFALSPPIHSSIRSVALVVSNPWAAAEASLLRKIRLCKGVVYGPNVITLEGLRLRPKWLWPDLLLVPSEPVSRIFAHELPELVTAVWPIGVDLGEWAPSRRNSTLRNVLIYLKGAPTHSGPSVSDVVGSLVSRQVRYTILIYGSYTRDAYRDALTKSDVMIVLGGSESQGLFLQEAWAADVPTLVRQDSHPELSAAPYLNADRGAFFSSLQDLENLLETSSFLSLKPRRSLKGNLTLQECSVRLRRIIEAQFP